MQVLNNLKTFTKIMGLSVILLVFIASAGGVGFYYTQKANSEMNDLYNNRLLPIEWLDENRAHARAIQAFLFDLMLNTDPARSNALKNDLTKRAEAFNKNMSEYEKTKLDPFEVENLKEMKIHLQKFRNAREGVIALAMQNRNAEAYAMFNAQARAPMELFVEKLVALSEYNVKVAGEIKAQNDKDYAASVKVILAVCVAALILGLILAWNITKAITVPLNAMVNRIGIMAEGDYSKDIQAAFLARGDEFGAIAQAFEKLNRNMRVMLRQIAQSSEQVAASSEQLTASSQQSADASGSIAASIQQVAEGSEKQVAAVNETSAIVQEISATMEEVSATASEMASMSEQTARAALEGKGSVELAVTQMGAVSVGAKQAQVAAEELKTSSAQIGEIVGLISTIAGQTNLLALNAAIEAARAGEQGRGFAVVAEEVRKLAEQSEQAAHQIKTLVSSNHTSIDNVVGAIEVAGRELGKGVELVTVAGTNFGEINNKIGQVTEQVKIIAKAINEAAVGSQRIVSSIKDVESISRDTAAETQTVSAATEEQSASMEQIAASSQALSKLAVDLQGIISRFRI